ncbi:MAG: hypothetical protein ABIV51_12165 [Saprospiraceae bacterium]
MKLLKTLCVICCLLSFQNVHAQLMPSGTWMVGGSIGISSVKNGEADAVNSLEFAPSFGFFFLNGVAIGINAYFSGNDLIRTAGGGPFLRGYLFKGLFLEGEYGYLNTKIDGLDDNIITSYAQLALGYTHMLNESVGLEPKVYYSIGLGDSDGTTEFGLSIGIQAFLNRN